MGVREEERRRLNDFEIKRMTGIAGLGWIGSIVTMFEIVFVIWLLTVKFHYEHCVYNGLSLFVKKINGCNIYDLHFISCG